MQTTTNTQQTHTPGPWQVAEGFDCSGEQAIDCLEITARLPNLDTRYIARTLGTPDRCPDTLPNARLIAAAPELLAILERIMEIIDSGDNPAAETHYGSEHTAWRAAIAKAKGAQ